MAPAAQKKVKKSADNINARLALVIKSGKYTLGYKSTIKAMRSGKCEFTRDDCPSLSFRAQRAPIP